MIKTQNHFPRVLASIGLAISITTIASAQTVIDFESLPVPASGFYNGDTGATGPERDGFTEVGERLNFGAAETLQVFDVAGAEFFNGYTNDFGSYNGFAWSNVSDSATPGFFNQYAAFPGGGSDGEGGSSAGPNYLVAFGDDSYINVPVGAHVQSIDVANTTWAYLAILAGNDGNPTPFVKQFGGDSGNDPDFFSVTLTGYDGAAAVGDITGSVEHFLADYRFSDNDLDYVQSLWQQIDLSALRGSRSIGLRFASSDASGGFINTPTYVAVDNLTFTAVPEPGTLGVLILGVALAPLRRRRVMMLT